MIDRVAQILQLEPGETRRALFFGGILFALTGSYTLVKTARDALFLAQLSAATLPYVYLGVGVLTTLAAAWFARSTRRVSASASLESAAWAAAISLALFAYLFKLEAPWVTIAFYLWVNVYGLILISQFWSFTNQVSHPHEAKRIFGIVGVGGILGGLFGGLVAPGIVRATSVSSLLLAAAALLAAAPVAVRSGARLESGGGGEKLAVDNADEDVRPARHPYVRWLALSGLCSVLVTTLVDYLFKVELQQRYPSRDALASFLGLFYTATNLAALTIQLFVTRWSLRALGAGWSAAVLPTGLGVGAALTMISPALLPVFATRLWDQVMRLSIYRTTVELFFFPLSPALRQRVKGQIQAGLERLGDAFAGLLILAAGATMGASVQTIAAVVLVLVLIWVGAWLKVRRGYVTELGRNLRRLSLDHRHVTMSLREASLLQEMTKLLDSPFERVVLQGVEMLEENAPERLAEQLPRLLAHPAPGVRARAVALAGSLQAAETRQQLAAMLHDETLEVRIEAMRAYCALGGENRTAIMESFLDSDDARLRETALECIAQYAAAEEVYRVRVVLERALSQGSAADRAAVARGLGRRSGTDPLHELIGPLLADPTNEVQNAALLAAGRAQRRMLVPGLIESLASRPLQSAARSGLVAFGDGVVGTLGDYLCDGSVPLEVRRQIPRVLGDIGTQGAVDALFRCREREDGRLAYRMLKAANRVRTVNPAAAFPVALVGEDLHDDVHGYLFAFVHYRSCPIGSVRSAERLLCIALNERMDQALNRIFRRLALIYSSPNMNAAYRGIISDNPRARGNTLEYLENALSAPHRELLLPLLEGRDEVLLRLAEARYGLRYVSYAESLQSLLEGGDSWLKACALFVIGSSRQRDFLPLVERTLDSPTPYVRETAAWVRSALALG